MISKKAEIVMWILMALSGALAAGLESTSGPSWVASMMRAVLILLAMFIAYNLGVDSEKVVQEREWKALEVDLNHKLLSAQRTVRDRIAYLECVFAAYLVITSRPTLTGPTPLTKAIMSGNPEMDFEIIEHTNGKLDLVLKSPSQHTVTVTTKPEE